MRKRRIELCSLAVLLLAVAGCGQTPVSPSSGNLAGNAESLAAKPPQPTPIAMTGAFRCLGPECAGGDRIVGDGAPYPAIQSTTQECQVDLAGSRTFFLDFTAGPAPCSGCRRTFDTLTLTATHEGMLRTNVVIPGTDTEATGGLNSIPVGATWPAKMKLIFNLPEAGGVRGWAVRFNPRDYPGSTHLDVTRTSDNSWVIEATTAHIATLVSTGGRRDGGKINEGFFVLPFRISVTRP